MKLFISPTHEVTWKINVDQFLLNLKKIYSNVDIHYIDNEKRKYLCDWNIKVDIFYLNGFLSKNLNSVVFDTNSLIKAKEFILLVRKSMPQEEEILIYDENFNKSVVLDSELNIEELEDYFNL
jgi:hypothetical protein